MVVMAKKAAPENTIYKLNLAQKTKQASCADTDKEYYFFFFLMDWIKTNKSNLQYESREDFLFPNNFQYSNTNQQTKYEWQITTETSNYF